MRIFKEFEIYTENNKLKDLGLESKEVSKMTVDLLMVNSYNETYHTDSGEIGTAIYLDSGDWFAIRTKYKEFKKILEEAIYENSI